MVLEYFTLKRNRKGKEPEEEAAVKTPVLNDEDEDFLHRLAAEAPPPPLPERPSIILDNGKIVKSKEDQMALMSGADQVPLPTSPPEVEKKLEDGDQKTESKDAEEKESKKRNYLSFLPSIPGRSSAKDKNRELAAADLSSAAKAFKAGGDPSATGEEAKKDEEDLAAVLDQLNLAAVNNRVFSFSKESHELMEKFTQVLKDIVNGVPTAYDDLEKLLNNSEGQLQKMFGDMPPFLQTLVKSLPSKLTSSLGPEILAAATEKPNLKVPEADEGRADGEKRKKKKRRIPSLRSMVSQQGAVAGMLRNILGFLKLRFPAFMTGTNVLMSLALFLLLFVFWYCHKRGRETRLARQAADQDATSDIEVSDMEDSTVLEKPAEEGEAGKAKTTESSGTAKSNEEQADAKLADMPSVLNLPEPQQVPLPETSDKGLEAPLPAQQKA